MLLTPLATPVRMVLPMFSQLMAEMTDSTASRIFFQLASRLGTVCTMTGDQLHDDGHALRRGSWACYR